MEFEFITLGVFTSTPYEGNPLAIIKVPASRKTSLTQEQKQLIAREFNLSESLFLHEKNGDADEWEVDIFTTTQELPFAGHPTIGAASYVLGSLSSASNGKLLTKAGPISIHKEQSNVIADIPHNVHVHKGKIPDLESQDITSPSNKLLADAERVAPLVSIVKGMAFFLIRLPSLELLGEVQNAVRSLDLFSLLDDDWKTGFVGRYYYVIDPGSEQAFAQGEDDGRVAIRTRMISDRIEDPATGSAACTLGSYLAMKSFCVNHEGVAKYEVTQGVEMGRKSVIRVNVSVSEADSETTSSSLREVRAVQLGGTAVSTMRGHLQIS